jgi:hypothetical protein
VTSFVAVLLKPEADKSAFLGHILHAYGPRVVDVIKMLNYPTMLALWMWSPTGDESYRVQTDMEKFGEVSQVYLYAYQGMYFFPTWKDRLVKERAAKGP